ncbi:MAG: PA14 domain-containing protein [Methanotrichaceae archaeon]|nr:PA14 domain-containing protein [Methanotrichaceae archaeon]
MNKNCFNGLIVLFIILALGFHPALSLRESAPASGFNERDTPLFGPGNDPEDIPPLGPEDKFEGGTKNHKPTVELVVYPQRIISGKPTMKDGEGNPCLAIIEAIARDIDGDPLSYTFISGKQKFGPDIDKNKIVVRESDPGRFLVSVIVNDFKGGEARDDIEYEVLTPFGTSLYEPTEHETPKNDKIQPSEQIGGPVSFGTPTSTEAELKGDIYKIPEGSSQLPDFNALSYDDYLGTIYTKKLDIPPRDFKEGFPGVTSRNEWFAIEYTGDFSVSNEGDYEFRLLSDDGSRLLIDGVEIIKNDGIHPPNAFKRTVYLRRGQHHIEVEYFQGPMYQIALQLFWTPPGGTEVIFEPNYL